MNDLKKLIGGLNPLVIETGQNLANNLIDKAAEKVGPQGIQDLIRKGGDAGVKNIFSSFSKPSQPYSAEKFDPNRISLASFGDSAYLPFGDKVKNTLGAIAGVLPGINAGQIDKEDYVWVPNAVSGSQKLGEAFAGDIGGGSNLKGWQALNLARPDLTNQKGDFKFDWNSFNIRNALQNGKVPGIDYRKAIGGLVEIGKDVAKSVK